MFEIILIVLSISLITFFIYKLKFENRYQWIYRDSTSVDDQGNPCGVLFYIDKYEEGIQCEYFYKLSLTAYIADNFIKTKNRYHRRKIIRTLFK